MNLSQIANDFARVANRTVAKAATPNGAESYDDPAMMTALREARHEE